MAQVAHIAVVLVLLFVGSLAQTSCQTLYGFEGNTAGWYTDSSTSATGVFLSTTGVTEGVNSVQFTFNAGASAIFKVEGPLDFTGYRYLVIDLRNVGGLTTIGLVVQSDTWTESSPQSVVAGQGTYVFDMLAPTWKTVNSGWQYTQTVNSLGSVQRIALMLYNTASSGSTYVDNVRKCLAGTPSSPSGSPSRSAAVSPTGTASRSGVSQSSSATPTPTRTPVSQTGTPSRSGISAVSPTGTPTRSSVSGTGTPTRSPVSAVSPSGTPTRSPVSAVSPSGTPTRSPVSAVSPSGTPTRSPVSAVSPSGTPTRSAVSAVSPSGTPTRSPVSAVSPSGTPTRSAVSAVSPSGTPTRSAVSAVSPSGTGTPSRSGVSQSPSATATRSPVSQSATSSRSRVSQSAQASASATPSGVSPTGTSSRSAAVSPSGTATRSAVPASPSSSATPTRPSASATSSLSNSCQLLYGFDGSLSGWYVDSTTAATGVSSSTSYVTQGSGSIKFNFNAGSTAIFKVEGPLDLTGYRYVRLDLANGGGLTTLGLVIESNTWTESSPQTVVAGQGSYTFDLQAATWKTSASNWQYTQTVQSVNSIVRIAIVLYNTQVGSAYVDNVRKCLSLTPVSPTPTPTASRSFVVSNPSGTCPGTGIVYPCGTAFCVNGCKYYYSGTNQYYLIYYSNSLVGTALDSAHAMGANVVRTWAFLDGGNVVAGSFNGFWLQQSYGYGDPTINYDATSGLGHLDDVIYMASQRGMKLILVLTDNWRSFGGVDQYVSWWGMSTHDAFFTDSRVKGSYKRWVSTLLNRVNRNTGIAYKNDPTIFAWELINEPRCAGGGLFATSGSCTSATITAWISEMSDYIRSIDTKHMIGVGDEGFFNRPGNPDWTYNGEPSEGGNFEANLALPNINFGTFHAYPDSGAWNKDPSAWMNQWISDHATAGVTAQKPVIMEEYGWPDAASRPNYYTQWTNAVYSTNLAGSNFWMLGVSGAPGDSYVVYYPDSSTSVIQTHGNAMTAKNTCFSGVVCPP